MQSSIIRDTRRAPQNLGQGAWRAIASIGAARGFRFRRGSARIQSASPAMRRMHSRAGATSRPAEPATNSAALRAALAVSVHTPRASHTERTAGHAWRAPSATPFEPEPAVVSRSPVRPSCSTVPLGARRLAGGVTTAVVHSAGTTSRFAAVAIGATPGGSELRDSSVAAGPAADLPIRG